MHVRNKCIFVQCYPYLQTSAIYTDNEKTKYMIKPGRKGTAYGGGVHIPILHKMSNRKSIKVLSKAKSLGKGNL